LLQAAATEVGYPIDSLLIIEFLAFAFSKIENSGISGMTKLRIFRKSGIPELQSL